MKLTNLIFDDLHNRTESTSAEQMALLAVVQTKINSVCLIESLT